MAERGWNRLRHHPARVLAWRVVTMALLWWILTEGRLASVIVAAIVLLLAGAFSLHLLPPGIARLSARGLAAFVPYFLVQSVLGGIDVASRALKPSLPLEPGLVEFRTTLPPGLARALLVAVVTLLPGTLAARLDEDRLLIHALDVRQPVLDRVAEVERRLSRAVLG